MIYIGIDPGVKTGFGLIDGNRKSVKSYKIHDALSAIAQVAKNSSKSIHVRVEDARQRKWFGNNSKEKLQGAGSIKRDSKIWEDFLTDANKLTKGRLTFEMVHPIKGGTKIDTKIFKQITGINERTSEHGRDAYMLILNYKKIK